MTTPTMHAVESSNIHSIGYSTDCQTLRVRFKSGRTYEYSDVPVEVFHAMLGAESIGKYFIAHVKDKYTTVEVEA